LERFSGNHRPQPARSAGAGRISPHHRRRAVGPNPTFQEPHGCSRPGLRPGSGVRRHAGRPRDRDELAAGAREPGAGLRAEQGDLDRPGGQHPGAVVARKGPALAAFRLPGLRRVARRLRHVVAQRRGCPRQRLRASDLRAGALRAALCRRPPC
jgi:hypothetical protein